MVESARVARDNAAPVDVRARQNATMMFMCIWDSVDESTKSSLLSDELHQDGPTIFLTIMQKTFTATFAHGQSTRKALTNMNPKKYNNDVVIINNHIRMSMMALRSASQGRMLDEHEMLYNSFNIFKRIRSPDVWVQFINLLENTTQSNRHYTTDGELLISTETKFKELESKNEWKPSDKSPNDVILALQAQALQAQPDRNKYNRDNRVRGGGRGGRGGRGERGDEKRNHWPSFWK
jgi:hypothetical protein